MRVPPAFLVPWQQTAIPSRPLTHTNQDGFAISHDGRLLAVTIAGAPAQEIALIDLSNLTAQRFVAPDPRLMLAHPAFSPDDDRLAMVATPFGGFGVSTIYILRLSTARADKIGDSDRSYTHPAFSWDGRKLAYFKDISDQPWRPGFIRPEYRPFVPFSLFERDLGSGEEHRINSMVLGNTCGLFYAPEDHAWYYCAQDLVRRNAGAWVPDVYGDAADSAYFGVQRVLRNQRFEGAVYLPVLRDVPGAENARLTGVLSDGRVFYSNVNVRNNEEHASRVFGFGAAYDGAHEVVLFSGRWRHALGFNLAASHDATVIAGLDYELRDASNPNAGLRGTLIVQRGGRVTQIALDAIQWRSEDLKIEFSEN